MAGAPWSKIGDQWQPNAHCRIPYALPEIIKSTNAAIILTEGERDADTLRQLGFTASSFKDWKPKWNQYLEPFCVVIALGDYDKAGDAQLNRFDPGREVLRFSTQELHARVGASGKDVTEVHRAVGTEKLTAALHALFGEELTRHQRKKPKPGEKEKKEKKKLSTLVFDIILKEFHDDAGLFNTPADECFGHVRVGGHCETWPILSRGFRRWVNHLTYDAMGHVLKADQFRELIGMLDATAYAAGDVRRVHLRTGEHEGKIYLDLADEEWRAVEVGPDGWRVISNPPVRFRRTAGMRPLPVPVRSGSLDDLRPFLNVANESDLVLIVSWLVAALAGRSPYPALEVTGEQGSAKSTMTAVLRFFVDPNAAPIRSLPREERDLFIAASNGHVLAFDNVSSLPFWLSDALCRLSTGGGWSCRQLYTDSDEVIFDGTRPTVMNGIVDFVDRPDLADRTIGIVLTAIAEDVRRPGDGVVVRRRAGAPGILGALLDMVAFGLRELPEVRLERLPRMADFALWATACEGAVWKRGTFLQAFEANRREMVENVLEGDPVTASVRSLMDACGTWRGTATGLLGALAEHVDDGTRKSKGWPATPRALSARLRRGATFLRKVGIETRFDDREGHARNRLIHIEHRLNDDEG
ncbi:MAG: toprim domain-containing protein [Rhodospirillales bacterium]|nr:toprim domain-containing protein [Rhodospirillales bacterium]